MFNQTKPLSSLFLNLCTLLALVACKHQSTPVESASPVTTVSVDVKHSPDPQQAQPLLASLHQQLESYRRIMVLLTDDEVQSPQERVTSSQVGQILFNEGLNQRTVFSKRIDALLASGAPSRFDTLTVILDYIESSPDLYDADRLAFREALNDLDARINHDSALPAIKLRQRIHEDIDALNQIERNYNQEITRLSIPFDRNRGIFIKREKWDDYVAHLRRSYTRKMILHDYGILEAYPIPIEESEHEIFGNELPPKTLVLTFDDGPHRIYTNEIKEILQHYAVPAVFFEVGRNIGRFDRAGKPRLGPLSKITRELIEQGYAVANHSMTHDLLSKLSGNALRKEVINADIILRAVDERRAPLFRFPYGARSAEGLRLLSEIGLQSVRWNIDSLDWADPVPNSVARRVLLQVAQRQRGIILFHDIHDRAVKALPQILEKLIAEGYQFAGWDGHAFSVNNSHPKSAKTDGEGIETTASRSWATVIGVDDYTKWPKLKYAANDAQAIANTLIQSFGFPSSHVILLKNREATRDKILSVFNDLANGRIQKNDRLFVFFAGHGATRQLSLGRDVGYIIPVDSDPAHFADDAISMTKIQNIAKSFEAKHVLLVMDACYSALGLMPKQTQTSPRLATNINRMSRQMLTSGGPDQPVTDRGPNGHSVFTWALLKALSGHADFNDDGLITGTELGAYVASAVSTVSAQTPAFGPLLGSPGGEFVFEIPRRKEILTTQNTKRPVKAINFNRPFESANTTRQAKQLHQNTTAVKLITVKNLHRDEARLLLPPAFKLGKGKLAQPANDLGLQLYKDKSTKELTDQFSDALELNPHFLRTSKNLGVFYPPQSEYAQHVPWLQNTLKTDHSPVTTQLNRGDIYLQLNNKDKARKTYTTDVDLQPEDSGTKQLGMKLTKL